MLRIIIIIVSNSKCVLLCVRVCVYVRVCMYVCVRMCACVGYRGQLLVASSLFLFFKHGVSFFSPVTPTVG